MAVVTTNPDSLIERETQAFETKDNHPAAELIAFAAKASGRHPLAIGLDMVKHLRGPAKLQLAEYVRYGMYDQERYSAEERRAFISGAMHGKIVYPFNETGWLEFAGDKWLMSLTLQADGIAQPQTHAVIDAGARRYHGALKLDTAEALQAFLMGGVAFPLFCKFNNGRWSLGANIITGADKTHVHLRGQDPVTYDDFYRDIVGDHTFLLQSFVENHSMLKEYTPTTATVRMVNLWRKDGLWTPHAVLKLPSAENEADNFWRKGNLVCALDVDTGEIKTCVGREGPALKQHSVHPYTGKAILGRVLPHWDKLREMNARVAGLCHPIPYQSQDIAITEDGPVEIEMNWGSAFELPQIASGRGFLTEEMREAFRSFGSKKV